MLAGVNPSTALARVLVDELVRGGVREAVLAPGSRSAPLALALHAADAAGRLRLHVRIDERSAAFLALGLAKASGVPVPVVTTSGTAVLNLHPAVAEASEAGVPLLLLTADRPPELRGAGANQTLDQVKAFGGFVRWFVEVGAPSARTGEVAYWRSLTCKTLAAATHDPGPVHLNLAFREPLVPDGDDGWPESLDGRADGAPWTRVVAAAEPARPVDDLPDRTVVVLGDGDPREALAAQSLAAARQWPVLAEPSSGAEPSDETFPVPDLVLRAGVLAAPDRVLVVGRPTLTRAVGRLISGAPTDVVARHGRWPDPSRTAGRVLPAVPDVSTTTTDQTWIRLWRDAVGPAQEAALQVLREVDALTEPGTAFEVKGAAHTHRAALVAGSSSPVRDLFLWGAHRRTFANRGAAGIDGTVSTAVGAALAHGAQGGGAAYALLGDLTFLHDSTGLVLGPDEPRPDLTVVVVNNDGGAIFSLLEQGGPEHARTFERVFGTPHGVDLAALCAATRTQYALAEDVIALDDALVPATGLRVVEARTDRRAAAELDRALHAAARRALAG